MPTTSASRDISDFRDLTFAEILAQTGWTEVKCAITTNEDKEKLHQWYHTNCKKRIVWDGHIMAFESKEEATLFVLSWQRNT